MKFNFYLLVVVFFQLVFIINNQGFPSLHKFESLTTSALSNARHKSLDDIIEYAGGITSDAGSYYYTMAINNKDKEYLEEAFTRLAKNNDYSNTNYFINGLKEFAKDIYDFNNIFEINYTMNNGYSTPSNLYLDYFVRAFSKSYNQLIDDYINDFIKQDNDYNPFSNFAKKAIGLQEALSKFIEHYLFNLTNNTINISESKKQYINQFVQKYIDAQMAELREEIKRESPKTKEKIEEIAYRHKIQSLEEEFKRGFFSTIKHGIASGAKWVAEHPGKAVATVVVATLAAWGIKKFVEKKNKEKLNSDQSKNDEQANKIIEKSNKEQDILKYMDENLQNVDPSVVDKVLANDDIKKKIIKVALKNNIDNIEKLKKQFDAKATHAIIINKIWNVIEEEQKKEKNSQAQKKGRKLNEEQLQEIIQQLKTGNNIIELLDNTIEKYDDDDDIFNKILDNDVIIDKLMQEVVANNIEDQQKFKEMFKKANDKKVDLLNKKIVEKIQQIEQSKKKQEQQMNTAGALDSKDNFLKFYKNNPETFKNFMKSLPNRDIFKILFILFKDDSQNQKNLISYLTLNQINSFPLWSPLDYKKYNDTIDNLIINHNLNQDNIQQLSSEEGQKWLNSAIGKEWSKTKQGESYLQTINKKK